MTGSFDRRRWSERLEPLIEVAYPRRCAGCGLRGRWVCDECLALTPLFQEPRCTVCSMTLQSGTCDCRALPAEIDRFWAAGPHDGWIRRSILSFKFAGETARASFLAGLMEGACQGIGRDVVLVPVPMYRKRLRERGYDQTALLAARLGTRTGLPVSCSLIKTRHTPHQVGLSAVERSSNLAGAFDVAPGDAVPRRVLLIDDVSTTGSTLRECAMVLRSAGADWVGAAVIAHDAPR